MRLFVALEIPAAVRDNLSKLVSDLRVLASQTLDKRPRWVRRENLHLTLKFIGEADANRLEGIRAALAGVHANAPVELEFRGLGFFPDAIRPSVLWVGVRASANLPSLAADIDFALESRGFAREQHEFVPHLTLARFKPPGMADGLRAAIEQNAGAEFGSAQVRGFHLIESKLESSGPAYTTLATFPFVSEP